MYPGIHVCLHTCHRACVSKTLCRKSERLDWMYAGGLVAKEDAAKRADDALMGKTVVSLEQPKGEASACEQAAQLTSSLAAPPAAAAGQLETWNRLNNDPLFAVRCCPGGARGGGRERGRWRGPGLEGGGGPAGWGKGEGGGGGHFAPTIYLYFSSVLGSLGQVLGTPCVA